MSTLNISEQCFDYYQLKVDSNPKSLQQVISWFEGLRKPYIPRKIWLECQTMLGEAFDNVLVHAHKKLPPETPIDIEVVILNRLIILKIWDLGSGFNIEEQKTKISQGVEQYAENGRGIEILQNTADYIDYINLSEKGNYLLIVKIFFFLLFLIISPIT